LGCDDVCSAEVARLLECADAEAIGNVELKGFKGKVPVFAVA
jgi:class 3 adenylate cyclase